MNATNFELFIHFVGELNVYHIFPMLSCTPATLQLGFNGFGKLIDVVLSNKCVNYTIVGQKNLSTNDVFYS